MPDPYYSPNPTETWIQAFQIFRLLVEVAGVIVAAFFIRRHPRPAVCVLVGFVLLLLQQVAWLLFGIWQRENPDSFYLMDPGRVHVPIVLVNAASALLTAAALTMFVFGAFGWRKTRGGAEHAAVATPAVGGATEETGRAVPPTVPTVPTLQPVNPISKGLYFSLIFVPLAISLPLSITGLVLAIRARRDEEAFVALGISCSSLLVLIVTMVTVSVLIYRMWSAIRAGSRTRTTPGKAIGFLFIPFFNFYWIFEAYRGWAVDYNAFIDEHRIDGPRASVGLATTICVLALCGMIPYLGTLIGLVNLVLLIIYFNTAMSGINAIARASRANAG